MSSAKMEAQTPETDFRGFIEEFKKESDRAAVILAAAKLDLLLYQLIKKVLKPCTAKADELLDGDSPLGTFSSRIMIAHRLCLIDDEFCRVLNLIRRIRNAFAHELSGTTLNSGAHRDRIRELIAPIQHTYTFEWVMKAYFDSEYTPREYFSCVVAICCARLDGAQDKHEAINIQPHKLIPLSFEAMSKKTSVKSRKKAARKSKPKQ